MLERSGKERLEMEMQWEKLYVVEKTDDGKYVFLACRPESSESARNADTLAAYAEKWLDAMKVKIKESTYMKYWNLLHSYILPELGATKWGALDRESIEAFCGRMFTSGGKKDHGLSPKTVTDTLSVLRRIFRYAYDHGASMPFDLSSVAVKKEQKEMKYLSRKQQEKLDRYLRSNLSDRNLGLLLCMFTGLRLGEVCALTWDDISFSEQTVCVRRTMQRVQTKDDPQRKTKIIITSPKSGSSARKIPIPRELMKILFHYRKGRKGYILTGRQDVYVEPRTMERYLDKVLKKLGMEHVNFHALRHTFATRCIEMDFDAKSLSEILGHADVGITLDRYVHPTMELKRNNMQKLSALLAVV